MQDAGTNMDVIAAMHSYQSMRTNVDTSVSLQHYAQCELLPREGACSPDTSVARQFRQHVEANGVVSA